MADVILEVKNLKKYFKTARGLLHAVDDVSFTIERGKTLESSENPGAENRRQEERSCVLLSQRMGRCCLMELILLL